MDLYWVTNIPTPYRNHRYAKMAEIFPEYGINFEVLYMAWTEPDRHWEISPEDFDYDYSVFRGIHPEVAGMFCHFNPGLLVRLLTDSRDIVVIGGYASPSHWLASLLCPPSSIKILSVESNRESMRRTGRLALNFKQFLIAQHDGFVITGDRTREMLEWIEPKVASKPLITLPNLIDKSIYHGRVLRRRENRDQIRRQFGVTKDMQLWMCPARLEPRKGLHLLIPQMAGVEGVKLCIAGTGSQKQALQQLAAKCGVQAVFLGQQTTDQMVDLYAAADLFVLPSLRDPSPLSPIEACAAHLPLLVSTRVGNFDDVLIPGKSGWPFNPDQPDENRETIERIASLSRGSLAEIGRISWELYRSSFDSDQCIRSLARRFIELRHRSYSQEISVNHG